MMKFKEKRKKEIAQNLIYAYKLIKGDSGSYTGSLDQFESQYTIGHELGIWINSKLELNPLAIKVAQNGITIKQYFDTVFFNYFQPINNIIFHPLFHVLSFMKENNLDIISKKQISDLITKICSITIEEGKKQEGTNSLFNMFLGTNFFYSTDNNNLILNQKYNICELIENCDISYIEKGYEIAKQELVDLKVYVDYLIKENRITKKNFLSKTNFNFPLNRIIFGAPGTGKSHSLEDSSSFFKNQNIVVDENTKIKNQYSLCNTYGDFVRLGMLYAEHFKTKTVAQIEEEFNFKRAYWIKKGSVLQNEISTIPEYTEEEFSEKIVDFIQNIPNRKKETLGAALGYKYSNLFSDASIETLQEEYQAVPTVAYWITYGVQAAQSNIEKESNSKIKFIERVTFHPNYSYSQFVGTYKPVQDSIDEKQIAYQYVPGPFMRIYASAKQNPMQNFLLIIEEINRANVAAVFGDVFQLLDRKSNGESEYPVATSEDIKKYLAKKGIYEDELSIPSNMYIWATMNSADQGVFPMDTAFKRRWEFEYIGIDDNEEQVASFEIPISETKKVNWNELRKAINNQLITLGVNEDKLLGPFFLNKNTLENALSNIPHFIKLFKSKVLMYLFEDAAKMKVKTLFKADKYIYSEICKEFDKNGLNVFSDSSIQNIYTSDISLKDETLTEEQNEEV